ncbi:MAG: hypothetical protein FWF88_13825, partial [Peptococcaceae bacterium]|nr:hypothetical protein [Peptococcaceae bacterium]
RQQLLGIGAEKERKAVLFCALCADAIEMRRHGARLGERASHPAQPPPLCLTVPSCPSGWGLTGLIGNNEFSLWCGCVFRKNLYNSNQ